MPRLFDLVSDESSQQKLSALAKDAARHSPHGKSGKGHGVRLQAPVEAPCPVPEFVALDVETTGLEEKTDRIIEIAAVRFINGQIREEYSSFVNPGIPIPTNITELTGIGDADVAGAPAFGDVVGKFLAFAGAAPLCGHQVDFDISFINEELKRLGRDKLLNQCIDSALLSRIVLPKLGAYSLKYVSGQVEHTMETAHRALDDAKASGTVAVSLLSQLPCIAPGIRKKMAYFAPHSLFKDLLFKSLEGRQPRIESPVFAFPAPGKRLTLPESWMSVEIEEVGEFFSETGKLSGVKKDFTPRISQTEMAQAVTGALNAQSILAAEAGTGTGKSLAYLVPAALFALKNDCRVVVSTHTRNLQDQLVSNDIPLLRQALGDDLSFTVLKGRANYLCKLRYQNLLAGTLGNFSPRERSGVLPLIRWAEETDTGDIEEQNQFNRKWFSRVWNLLSSDSHDCKGRLCPLHDACFLIKARQRALCSHLVIINHALFFSDICSESSFLGKIGPIIFDEAHHLESCGHRYLRVEVDTNRFNLFFEFVNNAIKSIEKNSERNKSLAQEGKDLSQALKRLRKSAAELQADVDAWAMAAQKAARYQLSYRDDPFQECRGFAATKAALEEMQNVLRQLDLRIKEAGSEARLDDLAGEIVMCAEKTSQLKADLDYTGAAQTDDSVFWVEGDHDKGWVKLCGVPLDIGEMLSPVWERSEGAVIFTSATLMVGDTMEYFKHKLGLDGIHAARTTVKVYPTPFDPAQSLCAVVRQAPDPSSPGYASSVVQTLVAIMRCFGRNTLALFTNISLLQEVYSLLRASGQIDRNKLFAQGVSGNRHALLDQFKQTQGALLLGTDSFWEGVDAPGESCEIVVIARLPFPVPTHPLVEALGKRAEEQYGDSFMSFAVPEAIIKFRQGTGRLIRSHTDRGALIILDNRIITKGYGKHFIRAINSTFKTFDTTDAMLEEMKLFFKSGQRKA